MKTNLRVSLAFISIFVLGLLSGLLLRPMLPFDRGDGRGYKHERGYDRERGDRGQQEAHRIRRMQEHMRRHLNLEGEQEEVLFSAIRENRRQREELMHRRKEEVRQEMRRQQREFELQLDSILTENQRAAWDSLYSREALRERRRD